MTSHGVIGVALTLSPIAQLPFTEQAWQVAAQSGFNAVLVLLLMYQNWKERDAVRVRLEADHDKLQHELNAMTAVFQRSLNHLTMAVTQVTLAMPFVPPPFHDQARELSRKVQAEEK